MIIIRVNTYTTSAGYPNIVYATSSHEQIDHYAWIIVFVVYIWGDRKGREIHYYKSQ